jgi:hypothetical protein
MTWQKWGSKQALEKRKTSLSFIGRKINQRNPKCQNIDELRTAILQEWQHFPQERLRRLVRSMTRRVTELHNGDIAGHGIVWTASCCKKCCTIWGLCGLALSSMNIGLSANAWLSKWGIKRGASSLSRYFWPASTVDITSSPCSNWLVTWSFGVDYSHMETGPLVWWKSFFVTPYRRSCKGLA